MLMIYYGADWRDNCERENSKVLIQSQQVISDEKKGVTRG